MYARGKVEVYMSGGEDARVEQFVPSLPEINHAERLSTVVHGTPPCALAARGDGLPRGLAGEQVGGLVGPDQAEPDCGAEDGLGV